MLQMLIEEQAADLKIKIRKLEIEAALDQIRTRTVAMQHSNELAEASQILNQQVRSLGIETWGFPFHINGRDDGSRIPEEM